MRNYRRLIKWLKPHVGIFVLAILCMLISSILGGISLGAIVPLVDKILAGKEILLPETTNAPLFIKQLIDKINLIPRGMFLNILIFAVLILFLIKGIILFFQSYFMSDVGKRVVRDLRDAVYNKLLNLSLDFYNKQKTGTLMARIKNDTAVVQIAISEGLADLLYQSFELIVYIFLVLSLRAYFSISWWLTLTVVLIIPIIIYPVIRLGQRLRKITTMTQDQIANMTSILLETISGIRIVKAFGMGDYESKKFKLANQRYYKLSMKSVKRIIAVSPLTEFVAICGFSVVLWFGGKQVIFGDLSPGAFIAFLAALFSMIKPIKKLSRVHTINQQALVAAERIYQILDREPSVKEKFNAIVLGDFEDSIEYKNVCFGYGEKDILKDINFTVQKGEIIAIVGPSGVGKTTLVNLLPRFYDVNMGRITIDGIDIRDMSIVSLRKKIGVVTQETILFNDTIKANMLYGNMNASDSEIRKASKTANAHDFIIKFRQGYYTVIGDRGMNLSGGEQQRLAIARAILKNPPVLILDEATSQLDTESELLVQSAIDNLMKERTVFVIAHRLSTIKHADKILVLDKGRIVDIGTHEILIKKDSIYKKLYELQFRLDK